MQAVLNAARITHNFPIRDESGAIVENKIK